jgi:hypothetical protein
MKQSYIIKHLEDLHKEKRFIEYGIKKFDAESAKGLGKNNRVTDAVYRSMCFNKIESLKGDLTKVERKIVEYERELYGDEESYYSD